MNRFTFRTEGFGDGERVPALLEVLGVKLIKHWEEKDVGDWVIDYYTIETSDSLEHFRGRMYERITLDDRFTNLHRCEQTLNEGDEPNEKWWAESTPDEIQAFNALRDRLAKRMMERYESVKMSGRSDGY